MKTSTLRYRLLDAQLSLAREQSRSVVLLVTGHAVTHKGQVVNELNHWLENRHTEVHALGPSSEEQERPYWWRYWRRVPERGRIGIFIHGWYGDALFARAERRLSPGAFADRLARIRQFEAELAAEGVVLVKLWMDIGRSAQRKRLIELQHDPALAWQVGATEWQRHGQHAVIEAIGKTLRRDTHAAHAPWQVLGNDTPDHQVKRVATCLLDGLSASPEPPSISDGESADPAANIPSVAAETHGFEALAKTTYRERLAEAQARLARNARELSRRRIPVVMAFEGHDAAGKGGSIHRVTSALDARQYRVHRIAAPSDEELAKPWSWRFWRRLPADGRIAIFDRSWYGRVLVERVEALASPAQWQRGYGEIRHFEQQLLEHGTVLIKIFLSIDKAEQLRRFEDRAATPHKRHKLTDEDWRNRERWDDYQRAIDEMFTQTHCQGAEWALIACDDKRHARLAVLEHVNQRLERRLFMPV
ncbi:polyphosphate:AMP phosphotransferase [Halomonas urumqiensis]|uniref:Polyphosphate:AMP phosphotransferase n=1 Tax=Halomonas urumqiensis TaxID=1684789 RepID=A0A2N7UCU8_9GAMM|nr:polyphosphate:AMP phosphotransferase [Halomonas urumqiensis]PMR78263.1 polyphosphate:AMP phosphotransferase [Halomonas urumqiensis]PTB03411.1 polyphosphate:AMP phosphotransferase [Halomonas urumqiensis]GHE20416.1 polyphosphate:AMP phosphotransferase [Halomonas urumqiensis]